MPSLQERGLDLPSEVDGGSQFVRQTRAPPAALPWPTPSHSAPVASTSSPALVSPVSTSMWKLRPVSLEQAGCVGGGVAGSRLAHTLGPV